MINERVAKHERGHTDIAKKPARDLIEWSMGKDWHGKVGQTIAPFFGAQEKKRLRLMDTDDFYADDLQWLEEALGLDGAFSAENSVNEMLSKTRIRTFHACRPRDVSTYVKYGLRRLRVEEAVQELKMLAQKHQALALLREPVALKSALMAVGEQYRSGRVFVGLDDRDLVDAAGHYLIYGSEYKVDSRISLRFSRRETLS